MKSKPKDGAGCGAGRTRQDGNIQRCAPRQDITNDPSVAKELLLHAKCCFFLDSSFYEGLFCKVRMRT